MSKPDETPPVKPDTTKTFKGLALPENFRDVTAERIGEKFALVGPPMRRIELPQGGGVNSDDPT
jgi:hypothetical protein